VSQIHQEVEVRLIIEYDGVEEDELDRNKVTWRAIEEHAEQWVREHLSDAGIEPDTVVASTGAGSAREFIRDDDKHGQQRRTERVLISVPVPEAWKEQA
jgi:hypothetical protein